MDESGLKVRWVKEARFILQCLSNASWKRNLYWKGHCGELHARGERSVSDAVAWTDWLGAGRRRGRRGTVAGGFTAGDGAVLRAWFFTQQNSNGNRVIVLHGISDCSLRTTMRF